MGIGRNWTREEEEQLAEWWGTYSVDAIAARLNRSRDAIIVRVQRLGLGAHLASSERISFNVLIKELGLNGSYKWYLQKLIDAGLIVHKQRVRDCSFRMVDLEEFWAFAEQNKRMFDFSRLDENALGAEPGWVKVKRTEDFKRSSAVKPHNAKWTKQEDEALLRLLKAYRYTYPEIAERLCRSEGAIQRRVVDLGIKERPIKADNHNLWTEEQLQTLCRMIKAGSNYESMSRVIGKSAKAIRGKVFAVYLTEDLDKVCALLGEGNWGDNRPPRTVKQRRCMNLEEKKELKEQMGKIASLLLSQVRKHFQDQDNWQRHLCQNWDEVRGCTVNGTDCDGCEAFERIRPQYCVRCGATFFERAPNLRCESCRTQRKKQAYKKYLRIHSKEQGEKAP